MSNDYGPHPFFALKGGTESTTMEAAALGFGLEVTRYSRLFACKDAGGAELSFYGSSSSFTTSLGRGRAEARQ